MNISSIPNEIARRTRFIATVENMLNNIWEGEYKCDVSQAGCELHHLLLAEVLSVLASTPETPAVQTVPIPDSLDVTNWGV